MDVFLRLRDVDTSLCFTAAAAAGTAVMSACAENWCSAVKMTVIVSDCDNGRSSSTVTGVVVIASTGLIPSLLLDDLSSAQVHYSAPCHLSVPFSHDIK